MLIRGDSTLLDPRPITTRVAKRLLLGRWIPRFDGYLTVGKLNEAYYEYYGADTSRFVPVRHFVDNEWFADSAATARQNRNEMRSALGIAADAVVFLFAGKFMIKKQPLAALEAFALVARSGLNTHLVLAGDGDLRAECEAYAAAHSLPVSFLGFLNQSRMPDAYAISDVLVLPSSHDETWGLVVNEAMASGLPAIVSDRVGCAPDLILDGETGTVFDAGSVTQLAERMRRFAESPDEIRRQGTRAARHIERYSLGEATENTVSAILRSIDA